ncbi:peptidase C39, bacteriocin processing [Pseudomonas sp. BAY1663]|uniref:C39 family peptidase n=1 Tax=Pseudomonas sp. BAY1663 TaxID=1439940 RepID=UPI00042E13D9|nr:C39 family peptidase [Pseudomonas sp. BAY1663]EXF44544.1 peptidase C39, bacteriocin processing [Pseudomonas sp. BAY1663]
MSSLPDRLPEALQAMAIAILTAATLAPCASLADTPALRIESLKEMREKAVVMQQWETSCAAASLATVLTYGFQDPVSERYVAATMLKGTEPAKVRARGGFSLLDMKRFVEQRGYAGDAYRNLALEDLKLFHAPIVPIQIRGFNHYVVLNAVTEREVLLADPAFGNRRMSLARFNEVWLQGLAFVVSPS